MRVLLGPGAALNSGGPAAAVARSLAGADGQVVSLRDAGVRGFSRQQSKAEVALLRAAILGNILEGSATGQPQRDDILGYVARGVSTTARFVAVADHVNLTWRSPLIGPNDDRVGPRFPNLAGVYTPDIIGAAVGEGEDMIAVSGVVAGVFNDSHLSEYEADVVSRQGYVAVSSELVPVVIVAAHLGLRVAAVVVASGS